MNGIPEKDDHKEWVELIPFYVNRTLSKEEMQALEMHLSTCPTCSDELVFEQSLQTSIHVKDVDHKVQQKLKTFNMKLDARIAMQSNTSTAAKRAHVGIEESASREGSLIAKLSELGRSLLTPGPALGGALAFGCCAVLAVTILIPTIDNRSVVTRGCKQVVKQHTLSLNIDDGQSLPARVTDLLEEYFPDVSYKLAYPAAGTAVVTINADACLVPLLVDDLEQEKISVDYTVRN